MSQVLAEYKEFVRGEFGLSDNDVDTADFLFWTIYYHERKLSENIAMVLKEYCSGQGMGDLVDNILKELTFTSKINFLERSIKTREESESDETYAERKKIWKDYISFLRRLNETRNQLFHQRNSIADLMFNNFSISDHEGKAKLLELGVKAIEKVIGLNN